MGALLNCGTESSISSSVECVWSRMKSDFLSLPVWALTSVVVVSLWNREWRRWREKRKDVFCVCTKSLLRDSLVLFVMFINRPNFFSSPLALCLNSTLDSRRLTHISARHCLLCLFSLLLLALRHNVRNENLHHPWVVRERDSGLNSEKSEKFLATTFPSPTHDDTSTLFSGWEGHDERKLHRSKPSFPLGRQGEKKSVAASATQYNTIIKSIWAFNFSTAKCCDDAVATVNFAANDYYAKMFFGVASFDE